MAQPRSKGRFTAIPLEEKLVANTDRTTDCWLWTGHINWGGYGIIWHDSKQHRVHRLSYETYKGEIPKGYVIDHLCRKRNCINPEHLEAVTSQENTLRGDRKAFRYVSVLKEHMEPLTVSKSNRRAYGFKNIEGMVTFAITATTKLTPVEATAEAKRLVAEAAKEARIDEWHKIAKHTSTPPIKNEKDGGWYRIKWEYVRDRIATLQENTDEA